MFQAPSFTFWNVVFTSLGAMVFWSKFGRGRLKAYLLSDLLNLIPWQDHWRAAVEFLIFVTLGCVVGIGVVQPSNATQALAAGLGRTGFFTHRPHGS